METAEFGGFPPVLSYIDKGQTRQRGWPCRLPATSLFAGFAFGRLDLRGGRAVELGFWVFGSKIKNTGFSPPFAPFAANHTPGPSAGARARFFAAQNPGKLLCSHQVCCCFRFAVGPAGCFFCRRWTCRSSRSIAVEQAPRTARRWRTASRRAVVSDLLFCW